MVVAGCRLPVARCRCGAGSVCGVAKQSPGAARPAGSRVAVGPGGLWGQVAPRAAANAGEERSDEGAQDIGCELGVVGAAVPKRVGEGQDPLSDGNTGEDPVDEVGCGVGHGAALARGTNAAALAREGDEPVEFAGVAVEPEETVSEDSAAEISTQGLLDEAGGGLAALVCPLQEGFEFLVEHAVEQRVRWRAWGVLESCGCAAAPNVALGCGCVTARGTGRSRRHPVAGHCERRARL